MSLSIVRLSDYIASLLEVLSMHCCQSWALAVIYKKKLYKFLFLSTFSKVNLPGVS